MRHGAEPGDAPGGARQQAALGPERERAFGGVVVGVDVFPFVAADDSDDAVVLRERRQRGQGGLLLGLALPRELHVGTAIYGDGAERRQGGEATTTLGGARRRHAAAAAVARLRERSDGDRGNSSSLRRRRPRCGGTAAAVAAG